jgi:hypothetical protein
MGKKSKKRDSKAETYFLERKAHELRRDRRFNTGCSTGSVMQTTRPQPRGSRTTPWMLGLRKNKQQSFDPSLVGHDFNKLRRPKAPGVHALKYMKHRRVL